MTSWSVSTALDKSTETHFVGLTSFSVLVGSPWAIFFQDFAPQVGIRSRSNQIKSITRMNWEKIVSESGRTFGQPPSTALCAAVVCDFDSSRTLQPIAALPAKANTNRPGRWRASCHARHACCQPAHKILGRFCKTKEDGAIRSPCCVACSRAAGGRLLRTGASSIP